MRAKCVIDSMAIPGALEMVMRIAVSVSSLSIRYVRECSCTLEPYVRTSGTAPMSVTSSHHRPGGAVPTTNVNRPQAMVSGNSCGEAFRPWC